jgi:3-oxoacyl-[acyl-carrier-protein] synthase II
MNRSVVITGMGAVSPLGIGARTLYERWLAGQSGLADGKGEASEFEPTDFLSVKEAPGGPLLAVRDRRG